MDATLTQSILRDRRIAYAVADRDLKVVEVGGVTGILGDEHATWMGRSLPDLVPELLGSEAALADVLTGALPRLELGWVNRETAGGETVYLTMVELPYRDPAGRIVGLLHLVEDVTGVGALEQHVTQQRNELRLLRDQLARRNQELAAANAELRRLDEMKSTFVSVAAHELRTPLTPITGYVEMLLDGEFGPLTGEQRKAVETVRVGAARLQTLTSALLDVTRIEAERVELVLRPTDLAELVQAVVAQYRPQTEAKAQRLTLDVPPDLPPALCDATRAAQVVGNLVSNASKYTPREGQIVLALGVADEEGFLKVSVADNGVGISPEDQPKLFGRFFRAKSAVQAEASGAGLGLYITRSLVELHGGRVWFESELGRGSTFFVNFPVAT